MEGSRDYWLSPKYFTPSSIMIKVLAMQIVSHKRRVDFPASLVMKCRKVTKHYLVACKQTFALAATVNFPYGTIAAHTLLNFFSFTKPRL